MLLVTRKLCSFVTVAFLCVVFSGCGSSSNLERTIIEGTISLDGNPIKNGEIRFYPKGATKGPPSGGPIKDGKYIAKAGGGVLIGTHLVSIKAFAPKHSNRPAPPEGGEVINIIPSKFSGKKSELERTVTSSTSTMNFDLKSK